MLSVNTCSAILEGTRIAIKNLLPTAPVLEWLAFSLAAAAAFLGLCAVLADFYRR